MSSPPVSVSAATPPALLRPAPWRAGRARAARSVTAVQTGSPLETTSPNEKPARTAQGRQQVYLHQVFPHPLVRIVRFMATWDEIRAFMRKHYRLSEDSEDQITLLIGFEDNRRQHITLSMFEAMDRQWLLFETRICRRELMDPVEACKLNGTLPVGHLALDSEGFFTARHTTLLGTLDTEELLIPLHALVKMADELEEKLTGMDMW